VKSYHISLSYWNSPGNFTILLVPRPSGCVKYWDTWPKIVTNKFEYNTHRKLIITDNITYNSSYHQTEHKMLTTSYFTHRMNTHLTQNKTHEENTIKQILRNNVKKKYFKSFLIITITITIIIIFGMTALYEQQPSLGVFPSCHDLLLLLSSCVLQ
jgi:hypothetical protein